MKTKLLLTIVAFVMLFTSCGETTNEKKGQLIIEGKDIWVREKSFTGNVIMRLNSGDTCEIIEKGEEVQLKDMLDHWYKIKFNETIGWVFGSQTNLKTGKIVEIEKIQEKYIEIITIKKTPIYSSDLDTIKFEEEGTKIKIDKYNFNKLGSIDGLLDTMYRIYDPIGFSGNIFGSFTNISTQLEAKDIMMPKYVLNALSPKTNQSKFDDFVNKEEGFYYFFLINDRPYYIKLFNLNELNCFSDPLSDLLELLTYRPADTLSINYKYLSKLPGDFNGEDYDAIYVYKGKYHFNKLSENLIYWREMHKAGVDLYDDMQSEEGYLKDLQKYKEYEKKISANQFTIIIESPKHTFYLYYDNSKWYIAGIEYCDVC